MTTTPTIALFAEASLGASLNCVGIAQELRQQGANPVFVCHPGFTGVFAEYGFKEYHLPSDSPADETAIGDYWQSFINTHLPHFDLDPLAQLDTYVAPTWDAIVDTAETAEAGLQELIEQIRPDAIVLDNVIMFPAVANAGCPWVRIISCAETELPDPLVPPYLSGLSADDAQRTAFETAYVRSTAPVHRRYNRLRRKHGLDPLPAGLFLEPSPYLNLLLSPRVVRHERKMPLPADRYVFLEGCVRKENHFSVPQLPVDKGPLVYMSFGSLGAIDTGLISRMIEVFATIPARFLVNVGGFLDAYETVPDNVFLGSWFPQPSVVAECDLFIHHGGNNSFCEALYFGVPSLVMPYCWDGHDNALRAHETGVGKRIDRAGWSAEDLREDITALLGDLTMKERLHAISTDMKKNSGTLRAARAILDTVSQ